ncbi:inositol monophosphatase family protein [Brevibacterium sp. CCUG 69071]|uniref:inositol monophosphatase family protein n=1 Tax=Brevibacterium sp. CCUG 69071 TaxID=2052937 RepID=UPI001E2BD1C3|nr:inositol monophosphatase family protein [Brevibacterium sp. CCUG 69071]MCD1287597.1 inositol-phosphate phosphatase [Brevibacterium sp. CCUG 69071]
MSAQPEQLPPEIADHPLILIASDLSAIAWEQMLAWRGRLGSRLDASVVDTKTSPNDLVTLADAEIESLVRGYLAAVRPDDLMVGEEGAPAIDPVEFFPLEFLRGLNCFDAAAGWLRDPAAGSADRGGASSRFEWHVDPIDGTVNYVRNIEHYAFSVGVCEAGAASVGEGPWCIGLVASPGLNVTWSAVAGLGAYRISGRMAARTADDSRPTSEIPARRLRGTPSGLSGRLLATGFAYTGDNRDPQLAKLNSLMTGYDDIRRCGSAAIDLCMIAEGKVNSYAERGLGIYDYAGGALIAEESGAQVRRGGAGGPTAAATDSAEVERLIATI